MRKAIKIILAVFAIWLIALVSVAAVLFLDVSALTDTSSKTLTPSGTPKGTALLVYDPGWSGAAKNVANEVANDLQSQGYTVTVAGIKSSAVQSTSDYDIIVAGGPVYAGAPTSSVKDFLGSLNLQSATKLGVYGSGSGASATEDIQNIRSAIASLKNGASLSNAVVVKIGQNENLTQRAADFVADLVPSV